MKKEFKLPVIEVIEVKKVDIVTTSFGQTYAGENTVAVPWKH